MSWQYPSACLTHAKLGRTPLLRPSLLPLPLSSRLPPHSMLPTPVYETGETLARGGSEKVEATNHYLSLVKRERNSRGVSNFLALFFSVFTIESSLLAKALTLVPILTPRLALRLTLRLALRLALRLVPRLALRLCACWPLNEKDSFPFSSQFVLPEVWQSHRGRDKRQAL